MTQATNTIQYIHLRYPNTTKQQNKLITYADDITILSTHTNINTLKQQVHSYLQDIATQLDQTK